MSSRRILKAHPAPVGCCPKCGYLMPTCTECGTAFVPLHHKQVTCCVACRDKRRRRLVRERVRRHRERKKSEQLVR